MIKRFLNILAVAALACACVKENQAPEPASPYDGIGVEHDGMVTLGFNVDVSQGMAGQTKALSETPDIKNIHVAVFDAYGGELLQYVKADPITAGPANDTEYQFTVEIKTAAEPRILHFLANGPDKLRFGTEQEVIGGLFTSYDAAETDGYSRKDAYWQRIEVGCISPRPQGSDDGSQAWKDYNTMVKSLSSLKLIRNFSKVTLSKMTPQTGATDDFKNFKILGMWFVNNPDRGSIAPYNRNTGLFGTDLSKVNKQYLDYDNAADVEDSDKGNYQGFTLASTNFLTPASFVESGDGKNMIEATDNVASGYVYEREKALTSPMYLIAKCEFQGAVCYYKIAMQDSNGSFYAMLRNFNYNVQIQGVSAKGYDSAAAALDGVPTGDISLNIDFKDLPNISDGNARMTVSATKLLIVGKNGQGTTAKFWYKYEPDITEHGDTAIHNDPATGVDATDKAEPHVLISYEGTEASTGPVIAATNGISIATNDEGGNRYVTINTTAAAAMPKTQTITIEGRNWDGNRYKTITRTVQLILRDALKMTLSASPNTDSDGAANIINEAGQPVVLHIGIEQDIPSSAFPLAFKIDASVNSLTPDSAFSNVQELPARYGTGADGRPTYWFEKLVSWAEYEAAQTVNGMKTFPVYFKTSYKGDTASGNATDIEVSNELFETGTVKVKNYTAAKFTDLATGGSTHKVGQTETFSFKMNKAYNGDITFSFKGIEPASTAGLTFMEVDASGKRVYTKAVNVAANEAISFDVVPYRGGNASITLSALLFEDATLTEFVADDNITLYINADGTGAGSDFLNITSTKVNGDNLVRGMKATMTIYIADAKASGASSVSVGSYTFNKKTDTSVPGYTAYSGTYTAPSSGDNSKGTNDNLIVKVGGTTIGSVEVPVYGIKLGDALTDTTHESYNPITGSGWYVIVNKAFTDYHIYAKSSQIAGRETSSYNYDYASLFGFNSNTTTVSIAIPSQSNGTEPKFISGTSNNTDVSLKDSGTSYTFQYDNGVKFYYRATSGSNRDRYLRLTTKSGNVQLSSTNTYNTFNIYPVTFVAPEE